jgi:CheY-like chemotaxis protein
MKDTINILLVDDDLDDHEFFKAAIHSIENVNCSVSYVFNGRQAMDYLLKTNAYKNINDPLPDFIALDVNMPVMDGFEFLKELKKNEKFRNIPVYILTTSRDISHLKKCKDLGCDDFFSKPPSLNELTSVIKKMLQQQKNKTGFVS